MLAVLLVGLLPACAATRTEASAEARCRERGFDPGSIAYAQCVHPDDARALERAQRAWEDVTDGD